MPDDETGNDPHSDIDPKKIIVDEVLPVEDIEEVHTVADPAIPLLADEPPDDEPDDELEEMGLTVEMLNPYEQDAGGF